MSFWKKQVIACFFLIFHSIYVSRLEIRELKKIHNQSFSGGKNFFSVCISPFWFNCVSAFSVTTRGAELPQEKRACFAIMTKSAELSLEKKAHFCQDSSPILQTRKEIITQMCMCAYWNRVQTLNLLRFAHLYYWPY